MSLSTGLQGPKISRTDFSRNHSCLCSKYSRPVGENIKDYFVFWSYKYFPYCLGSLRTLNKVRGAVRDYNFYFSHLILSLLACNFEKVRKSMEVRNSMSCAFEKSVFSYLNPPPATYHVMGNVFLHFKFVFLNFFSR